MNRESGLWAKHQRSISLVCGKGAKHQRSGSECGSVAVTDIEREVFSVLLVIDIADLGGRVETGRKIMLSLEDREEEEIYCLSS